MRYYAVATMAASLLALPAFAQSGSVSAKNPAGIVRVLTEKGLSPKLGKDSYGDPSIDFELEGYKTSLYFYDCDEDTHVGCTSVQLRAGFDREKPWDAASALAVAKKYRFASVWLDDSGDPWVQWDILTGDGIPATVFAEAVDVFGDTLRDTAETVFAD